jgi:Tol biopolymer transport system component
LRQLTFGDTNQFVPRWSRDGKWVYFSSGATRPVQISKISPQGGTPVQVTRNGGFAAMESPDGKWLYYTKNQALDTSLWKVALTGGEEIQVLPSVRINNVDLVPEGIYFRGGPYHAYVP